MVCIGWAQFFRTQILPWGALFAMLFSGGCKKTVVSDRVIARPTPTPTVEGPRKGIGDGLPDTTAIIRLTGTRCSAERITEFEVKVAGLKNTQWTKFTCSDKSKEIRINTKSGYCNVLQLRARVSITKTGLTEEYVRETAKASDQQYFIVDQNPEGNASAEGINIHFEDTTDAYWNKTYQPCVDGSKAASDLVLDVIEGNQKSCTQILGKDPAKPAAVDWDDFEFSVESDQVQFSVEAFPNVGCSPN
jgi:hypothetical protein